MGPAAADGTGAPGPRGRLYVGTSGFAYPGWAPRFYPGGLKGDGLLPFYADRFPACELNNTFYQQPSEAKVATWLAATPDDFRFAVKAQRGGSFRALRVDPVAGVPWLTAPLARFGDRLGSVLFRVPEQVPVDVARLDAFLAEWPPGLPLTMEFQDPSWQVDEVFAALARAGAALCATELPQDDMPPPLRLTGRFLYLRLRRHEYARAEIEAWAARLSPFLDAGTDAFVFFRHDETGRATEFAAALAAAAAAGQAPVDGTGRRHQPPADPPRATIAALDQDWRMRPTPRRSSRLTAALAAFALLAAACGASTGSPTPRPSADPGLSAMPSPRGTTADPGASPSGGSFDPAAVGIALEVVTDIPGRPLAIAAPADGSGRLFVVGQDGRIWLVRDGRRAESPFLDIAARVTAGGEQGLLGLAFHPSFPTDPRFFVYYTDRNGRQVVSQWRVATADGDEADHDSEVLLLRMDDFAANHNGGALVFGPDGYLYISTGDGGGGGDPRGNGQRLDTHLGKILRIDVDTSGDGRPYGIPADNPFRERAGAQPEIWVTGLRNPWRISFDRATGDLWIGDVGQGTYEEIDVVRAGSGGGQNFGWNITEGFNCFPSGEPCAPDGLSPPVTAYDHGFGCSVTGGVVYRGAAHPALVGGYLFADYCSGNVWVIDAAADEVRDPRLVLESGRSISSFGEDESGEVHATDLQGELLRVVGGAR